MDRSSTHMAEGAEPYIIITWRPGTYAVPRNGRYCAVSCDARDQGWRSVRVYKPTGSAQWIVTAVKNDIRHRAYLPADLVARIEKFDEQQGDAPVRLGGRQQTWRLEVYRAERVIHETEQRKRAKAKRRQDIAVGLVQPSSQGNASNHPSYSHHGRFHSPAA